VQLDGSGNGMVDFQSVVDDAVPCALNTLTTIVDNVLGWETVNNPNAAIIGKTTKSDAALRIQRKKTLALQGTAISQAIISALNATTGVQSLQYRENVTNGTLTIDGVSLLAHSVWACVQGGLDADVAQALLINKSCGAAWNGATSVAAIDPASGQTYTVKFDRPTPVTIWVKATVKQISPVADVTTAVTSAIINWANGLVNGITGLSVGASVSPFEIAAAIVEQVSGIYVQKLEVSPDGAAWQTTEYPIAIDHIGTIISGHITVVLA
jgi:hypothetical protein